MIRLTNLMNEAEAFTATNKSTGKTSVFKSKDARDAAIKAGTHADKDEKAVKGGDVAAAEKPNMFSKDAGYDAPGAKSDEPKEEPKQQRKGNPAVNKATKAKAEELGITPQKLGKEEYQKKMAQAAYEALTDANFHSEARELISKLEGKPEWAEKPDFSKAPEMGTPEYDEWQKTTVYSSEYYDADDDTEDLGVSAAQEAGWSGDDAADSIAFTLRMNGFHNLADTIQSVIKENKSTKLGDLI